MSKLSGIVMASAAKLFSSSAEREHDLGSVAFDVEGNRYRYAKAGAVALVTGTLLQAPAQIANHQDLAPAATAAGAVQVTVTLGATALTANYYAGGYAIVTVTPGVGYRYRILSHPAADASAAVVLTLEADNAIVVALTTSSRIDLVPSPYSGVVINPTTATSSPIGVAVYPIAIGEFGWIQDGGVAAVLADGAVTVGTNVIASNGTAGAIEPGADAADLQASIGIALTGIATTEYGAIRLDI